MEKEVLTVMKEGERRSEQFIVLRRLGFGCTASLAPLGLGDSFRAGPVPYIATTVGCTLTLRVGCMMSKVVFGEPVHPQTDYD
jgi:hypothetical protein